MKAITIRDLHAKTGEWVRQASEHGEILVTDNGRTVAKLVPEKPPKSTPYFSRRRLTARFRRLAASGKLSRGTDSTLAISADREDRNA
jgi:prevent-host-death family protein